GRAPIAEALVGTVVLGNVTVPRASAAYPPCPAYAEIPATLRVLDETDELPAQVSREPCAEDLCGARILCDLLQRLDIGEDHGAAGRERFERLERGDEIGDGGLPPRHHEDVDRAVVAEHIVMGDGAREDDVLDSTLCGVLTENIEVLPAADEQEAQRDGDSFGRHLVPVDQGL